MKQSFVMSSRLAGAVSLVMEQNPKDWGAKEHMSGLRYLVLACSDKAKLSLNEIVKLPPGTKLTVDWDTLKSEFHQGGLLAECANTKKHLADDYPQFAAKAKTSVVYA